MRYRSTLLAAVAAMGLAAAAQAAAGPKPLATIFKNPQCSCCEAYGEYLRKNGYQVKVVTTHDGPLIKRRQGIPADLEGCHTTLIGGYFVEGHIKASSIDRLLSRRPDIKGISLPGMPPGTPGMGGPKMGPLTVYAVARNGKRFAYAVE